MLTLILKYQKREVWHVCVTNLQINPVQLIAGDGGGFGV